MSYLSNIREQVSVGRSRKYRNKIARAKLLYARKLRREPTDAEKMLLPVLRSLRQEKDISFIYQALVAGWIADFMCRRVKLLIEIDGSVHAEREEQDRVRDQVLLEKFGFHTIRFTNDEVFNHLNDVKTEIILAYEYLLKNKSPKSLFSYPRPE